MCRGPVGRMPLRIRFFAMARNCSNRRADRRLNARMIALDLLFPRECLRCGAGLAAGEDPACGRCDADFGWIGADACARCGAALKGAPTCGECEGRRFSFAGAVAAGMYDGRLRALIHAFKFHRQVWLGRPLAARMAARVREAGWAVDAIVPVPTRLAKIVWEGRLHGAPETLARRLSREL